MRLIEMQYVAWFQIKSADETQGDVSYKEVQCMSLEDELIDKPIYAIDGVFSLYDSSDQEHSLLHIIPKYCNWTVGYVSNSLLSKWRTFKVDSEKIYNFLTGNVAKSFNCLFTFDTFAKTINAYTLDEIGKLTDIIISNRNILKEYTRNSDKDNIATVIRVRGGTNTDGTNLDIRSVNTDGSTEIMNVDYYRTAEWMSQGLIDALNAYETAYNTYSAQYTSAIETLKQYQSELDTLNNQLVDIKSQKSAQEQITGSSVKLHGRPPIPSESDYTIYQNAINTITSLIAQKVAKENEIAYKNSQISNVENTLSNISTSLDKAKYFTSAQLKELKSFMKYGDEYCDDTFQATETMTSSEIISLKLELRNNALKELLKVCRPQYTIDTTVSNLWTIKDEKDCYISYDDFRKDCVIGNLITLMFRNDYWLTVRLMSIEFDFDDLENVKLTFSDKSRLDDALTQMGEIQAQASRTATALSLAQYGYDTMAKKTSSISDFMNGALDATLNKMQSNEHEETVMDGYGLHMKRWDENTNSYSPYQSWWNANTLLFSNDGFKSAKTGIGQFTNTDGQTFYGVIADTVVGKFMLTSALTISNENNTITMNKDGATFNNCNITINKDTNSIFINASDGIRLTKNGVNQFYFDAYGNLTLSSTITASTITGTTISGNSISGGTITGTSITASTITGNTITGGSISIGSGFSVDSNGVLAATGANISGNITGSTITGSTIQSEFINGSDKVTLSLTNINFGVEVFIEGQRTAWSLWDHSSINFSSNAYISSYGRQGISIGLASSPKFTVDTSGAVTCTSLNVGGSSLLTTGNYTSYCAPISHSHGALYDDGYQLNWAGSSCLFAWNGQDLGQYSYKWGTVYATTGTINTSDKNLKNSIENLSDLYKTMIKRLSPVRYKYNDGTSNRYHTGFIAQDVESLMQEINISDLDFAGFIKSPLYAEMNNETGIYDTNSEITGYTYGLRYSEFIAPAIAVIQDQQLEIDKLKQRLTVIENYVK
jgi:hypothetical protein